MDETSNGKVGVHPTLALSPLILGSPGYFKWRLLLPALV
jgi:hypothetical protein